ncbi:MAG TPA: M48 family metalloprotease [Bacteroidales bacterium]|nr:M48 family metalloprotease [Bacteroidales bacterium]HPF02459.1 M48 family metalloprotease [Bacteroidales bacterium]HPJ59995.1 M48 family metalloprotease [Bacteroidales bacterium]HPR12918.1 M48 family metalloprotease [Bacteroidales bacterium]HRW86365.1 M48 family metalloprotease [Bacteroidales bacterium]
MKKYKIFFTLAAVLSVILLIVSCAINPVTGKRQIMLMSEDQEVALGASYDPQVLSTFGLYENPALASFVQEQGTRMGKISHRPGLQYHIKVLDSPVVNAFAVPGGYIYLTRGILAQLNSEAELAGVIGHEMGHITARHSASQQTKQMLGQLVLIGSMIASERLAQYADYAMQGMQLLFLKFSRDDERQADRLGVQYSSLLGYDAKQMAEFFKVLYKMQLSESEGGVPTFLSTHPDPGDRYNTVYKNAQWWQDSLRLQQYTVNHDGYLKLINGLVYGEDPRQGYVAGSTFFHPELKFQFTYPTAWQFQNSPMQVTMAPSDGNALIVFMLAQQKTLKAAADTALAQFGLTLSDSRDLTVNGLPALATLSSQTVTDQNTGAQSVNVVMSYFISYNNLIYVFHGVSAEPNFSTYTNAFSATMGSFARLTDPARINVTPEKIIVKAVPRSGTLSSAFSALGVSQARMEEMALLNNMELTDKVSAGRMIKIAGK